jgi:parallel beta-helix repeat protein
MFLATLRKLFAPKPVAPIRKPSRGRLGFEALEDRSVPATFTVGAGGFATIQAALDAAAASPGADVVTVSAGTYTEAVVINDAAAVTLRANGAVTLRAPADVTQAVLAGTPIGAAVIDIYSKNVTVDGLTVDGSTNTDGELFAGIRVINGGSATIKNNTVTKIGTVVAPVDAQAGTGIQVGTSRVSVANGGGGAARVTNNTVTAYKKVGILVDGAAASGTVRNNTVTGNGGGEGGNGGIVQYGIQSSTGASVRAENNTVSNNTATAEGGAFSSGGILLVDLNNDRSNVVARNTLSGNVIGVFVDAVNPTSNDVRVVNNDVTGSNGFAGIFVTGSKNVEVKNNEVFNNTAFSGIAVTLSTAVEVEHNTIRNNPEADGIYVFGGSNNKIKTNDSYSNGFNGILLEDTSNNWVWNNSTRQNALNGIKVLGGTGNDIWLGDSVSNVQDGILMENTNCFTIVGNYLACNGGAGLRMVNSTNGLVAFNLINGNSGGSIVSTNSTYVGIANRTDTPPVREGTSGAAGTSEAFSTAVAAADADTAGLAE